MILLLSCVEVKVVANEFCTAWFNIAGRVKNATCDLLAPIAPQILESDDENGIPRRTEDLFNLSSCGWTEFYTDDSVLHKVWEIYESDYALLGWYNIDVWKARLNLCLGM